MKNLTLLEQAELSDTIFDSLGSAYSRYIKQGKGEDSIKKLLLLEAEHILEAKDIMTPKEVVSDFFNRL